MSPLTLPDKTGFGMELADLNELSKKYLFDPNAPDTVPNPRFPKAA